MENERFCKCGSENLHFVKYEMKNKIKILRKQCFDCGYLLTKNYKRTLVSNFESLPDVDETFREVNYNKKSFLYYCKDIFSGYRKMHFERSKNYYRNVYLRSEEWKVKRDLIMQYYQNQCQDCSNEAKDVHHLHYNNIFCEKFNDLIPLCRTCHEKRHETTPVVLGDISIEQNVFKYNYVNHQGIRLKEGDIVNRGKSTRTYLIKESLNNDLILYSSEGEMPLSFYFDDGDNLFYIEGNIFDNPKLIYKIL